MTAKASNPHGCPCSLADSDASKRDVSESGTSRTDMTTNASNPHGSVVLRLRE
jgi:hypothetical protein